MPHNITHLTTEAPKYISSFISGVHNLARIPETSALAETTSRIILPPNKALINYDRNGSAYKIIQLGMNTDIEA